MTLNLEQWLSKIAQSHPKSIDLSLDRITRIAQKLDLHKWHCPVITVAGTNGKGSVCAMLESLALSHHLSVGLYTSPHLYHFNERIRINGQNTDDEKICQAFSMIENSREDITLSYFETATLAALWCFKQASPALDLIILEVGLGGRLDAVNCVDADIAVITSIDYDHEEYLGSDLESIGFEKAGILRENGVFISGLRHPPNSILARATELKTDYRPLGEAFDYQASTDHWHWQGGKYRFEPLPLTNIRMDNAATAMMAFAALAERLTFSFTKAGARNAIEHCQIQGRQQWLKRSDHTLLLDVAHNPAACSALAESIAAANPSGRIHAVCSFLKDKNIEDCLKPLAPHVAHWSFAPIDDERGASTKRLLEAAEKCHLSSHDCEESLAIACQKAVNSLQKGDILVVFGSFHVLSEVTKILNLL